MRCARRCRPIRSATTCCSTAISPLSACRSAGRRGRRDRPACVDAAGGHETRGAASSQSAIVACGRSPSSRAAAGPADEHLVLDLAVLRAEHPVGLALRHRVADRSKCAIAALAAAGPSAGPKPLSRRWWRLTARDRPLRRAGRRARATRARHRSAPRRPAAGGPPSRRRTARAIRPRPDRAAPTW